MTQGAIILILDEIMRKSKTPMKDYNELVRFIQKSDVYRGKRKKMYSIIIKYKNKGVGK